MTSPLADPYLLNGFVLNNLATRIEVAENLQTTPGTVGDDVEIDGMDGVFDPYADPASPRRAEGPGSISFTMSLLGVDPTTGLVPGGSSAAAQYFSRWDEMVRRFHRRTLTVAHPRPDGTTRTAVARLLGSIPPSREPASAWFGRFKADLLIPSGFWEDGTTVDTGLVTVDSGGTLDLSGFATATAPCSCSVRWSGTSGAAANNPKITLNSRSFQWAAVIDAGRQVLADSDTGLITEGAGSAWTPGYSTHVVVGSRRYFEVDPSDASQSAVITTTGGSVQVQVAGKRKFRTS